MTRNDEKILAHLKPITEFADTYLVHIYYKNKDEFMYTVFDKVKDWVEKNGGVIVKLSGKQIIGEKKGFAVKIRFPAFSKRDMKNIMATLYN